MVKEDELARGGCRGPSIGSIREFNKWILWGVQVC